MSYVIAAPEQVQAAAQDLAGIRTSLAEAAATIAGPTTGIVPAAADEVSATIAAMFGNFGQEFQLLSAQAQGFHAEFVNLMPRRRRLTRAAVHWRPGRMDLQTTA